MRKMNLILALFMLASAAWAQTAEEIVAQYHEVLGGQEKLATITNIVSKGTAKAQGGEFPVTSIVTEDGKMLLEINFQGLKIVQPGFDGENMWMTNFQTNKMEKATEEQSANFKKTIKLDFPVFLYDYEGDGTTIELLGEENKEGVDCYKIKRTAEPLIVDGEEVENTTTFYFDKETFVLISTESISQEAGPIKGQVQETILSDYQEVDGVYMPFTISSKIGGFEQYSFTSDEILLNQELEESTFQFGSEE